MHGHLKFSQLKMEKKKERKKEKRKVALTQPSNISLRFFFFLKSILFFKQRRSLALPQSVYTRKASSGIKGFDNY